MGRPFLPGPGFGVCPRSAAVPVGGSRLPIPLRLQRFSDLLLKALVDRFVSDRDMEGY